MHIIILIIYRKIERELKEMRKRGHRRIKRKKNRYSKCNFNEKETKKEKDRQEKNKDRINGCVTRMREREI